MRRTIAALGIGIVLVWFGLQVTPAAQGAADTLTVTIKGLMPGSALSIALNGGKIGSASSEGTVTSTGTMDLVLNIANRGKIHAQVQVTVRDCHTSPPTIKVYMLEVGQTPPKEDKCDDKVAGLFWLDQTPHVTIQNSKISTGGSSTTKWIIIGGGGAAATVIAITAGGGGSSTGGSTTPTTPTTPATPTTPTPTPTPPTTTTIVTNGTYTVVFVVSNDPNGHAAFVLYQLITQLIAQGSGSTATITGNGPWQTVTATVANGVLGFDGTGAVAGRTNVRIRGTLTVTATGAISGSVTLGEPPSGSSTPGLPNGPITYSVSGQRSGA